MKILVATDGSTFSERAIDALIDIVAKPKRAKFKVVAAFELPAMIASDPFAGGTAEDYDQVEESAHSEATERAEEAAERIRSLFPSVTLDLTTEIVEGAPERVIIETAEVWQADLIVVGSHGSGFWERTLLGSVSNAIVNNAPCAVLLVRNAHQISDAA